MGIARPIRALLSAVLFVSVLVAPAMAADPLPGEADHINPPARNSIVVVKSEFRLYLFRNGEFVKSYPVAIGRTNAETPVGRWRIDSKYYPDPSSVYGPRKMRMYRWNGSRYVYTAYNIHGTNNPSSIGTKASAGCIRLYNKDILDLFPRVPLGTIVETRESGKPRITFSTGEGGREGDAPRMATYTHNVGKSYTAYGYFKPRRAINTDATVRVLAYRYERKADGQMGYVYKRSYLAKVTNPAGSVWSKYSTSVELPSAGKWRLRVRYYDDGRTLTTTSGYRTVTVAKPSVTFSTGEGGREGDAPRMATYTHNVGKSYTAYGYFKPRRAINTDATVRVLAYRYERKADGQMGYVYKRSYLAKVTNPAGSVWSKYSTSVELPSAGKWRLRVRYYDDGRTLTTTSGYRSVTVR